MTILVAVVHTKILALVAYWPLKKKNNLECYYLVYKHSAYVICNISERADISHSKVFSKKTPDGS